jgi:hypothetical protein
VGVTRPSHLIDMTRVLSIVMAILLAVSGLPLTAGVLTQSAHACCLAHGAHHCATVDDGETGAAFNAVCPHHAGKMLTGGTVFTLTRGNPNALGAADRLSVPTKTSTSHSSILRRSGRAPPVLI